MSSNVVFKYGDYEFEPAPLFTIDSEPLKTPDGSGYGIKHTINLEGDLITIGTSELDSGILGVFDKIEILKDALNHDGKLLLVSCNDQPILSGYPLIDGYNFSNESDNYTRRAKYTVNFTMPSTLFNSISGMDSFNDSAFPPYIETCSESWDVEFQDERMPITFNGEKFGYAVAATHTVDVTARITYTGDKISNNPWEDAKEYAISRLGFDDRYVNLSGILGLPGDGFERTNAFNQYRQVSSNKTEGTIQVVETFIVTPSGSGIKNLPNNAIETFDISTSQNDGIITVGIQGEIRGLANISYPTGAGLTVNSDKFSAATGYYNIIKPRLFDRAQSAFTSIETGGCFYTTLNPQVRSRTVGMNPIEGSVTYDFQYDNSTDGCITGDCIISQNITIDDQLESDVFATQVVLGRATGPILQDIGTITARVRTVNVEIVTVPPSSCATVAEIYAPVPTGQVEDFIAVISGDLEANYSQVFVSSQTQNWNFTAGRYTKSVAFTYNNCST